MDIFTLLRSSNSDETVAKKEDYKLQNINAQAFGEAEDFGGADSFSDFVDGGMPTGGEDQSMGGGGYDDFGGGFDTSMDGGFGDESQGQDGNPKDGLAFLEQIDESEVPVVEKLISSFSSLYHSQRHVYTTLSAQNMDTSDHSEEVEKIKNQYKQTLKILKEYITTKLDKESTTVKAEMFVEFKFIFNNLAEQMNSIMKDHNK